MTKAIHLPSPLQSIYLKGQKIHIKREDLIHLLLSGNKYRKLKYNIHHALNHDFERIISFGGAFSNHIHALAFTCQHYKIPLLIFVRGDKVYNPTLDYVRSTGAEIQFIDRTTYKKRHEKSFLNTIHERFPKSFIIPEGGTNLMAVKGVQEMMAEIYSELNVERINFCVSYGSGGTSIGMMSAMRSQDHLHVFSSLKMAHLEADFLKNCGQLKVDSRNYHLYDQYHFGGFAKYNTELIEFINHFKSEHKIALDPIYTGKLLFGLSDLIQKDKFGPEEEIVVIHSGGLQGISGFNYRFGNLLD